MAVGGRVVTLVRSMGVWLLSKAALGQARRQRRHHSARPHGLQGLTQALANEHTNSACMAARAVLRIASVGLAGSPVRSAAAFSALRSLALAIADIAGV